MNNWILGSTETQLVKDKTAGDTWRMCEEGQLRQERLSEINNAAL